MIPCAVRTQNVQEMIIFIFAVGMFSNSWVLIKARKRYNNPYVRYVLFDTDLVSHLSINDNDKFFFAKLGGQNLL